MILDSSAVVAILLKEPGHEELVELICNASWAGIGAPTMVEATIVLSARIGSDARGLVGRFLEDASVDLLPFEPDFYPLAMDGWLRFGKGRHSASLNIGDCFSYAMAIGHQSPLLYIGNDFAQTDVPSARSPE